MRLGQNGKLRAETAVSRTSKLDVACFIYRTWAWAALPTAHSPKVLVRAHTDIGH
jgi:hypothetical protein